MINNWHAIWERRSIKDADPKSLADLIAANGFDSGAGKIAPEDWLAYAEKIIHILDVKNGDSVFEVGCGSGAFLFALSKFRNLHLGGIDYSTSLVGLARHVLPAAEISKAEANSISANRQYDFVVANGVFHYFPEDYASAVLKIMLKKAYKAVALLDVPNLHFRQESERARADKLSEGEYHLKYQGLPHTYFDPTWLEQIAIDAGYRRVETSEQIVPNYAQSKYRFNSYMFA